MYNTADWGDDGGSHLAKPQGRFGSSHSANLDSAYYIGIASPVPKEARAVHFLRQNQFSGTSCGV